MERARDGPIDFASATLLTYKRFHDDFRCRGLRTSGATRHGGFADREDLCRSDADQGHTAMYADDNRSWRSRSRSNVWLRHDCLCRRAVGRRWITIDTSRVALTLARQRLMGPASRGTSLRTPSRVERRRAIVGDAAPPCDVTNDIRHGFVYERVPHVTLKSIANNPDIKEGMSRERD